MTQKNPVDIATAHTASFIIGATGDKKSILKIGCGEGDVALALQQAGHDVTAIDANETSVDQARGKGVNAYFASWPAFDTGTFDVIAFTRSLHHIDAIDDAIIAAHSRLNEGGMLAVEDFAFNQADDATIDWLLNLVRDPVILSELNPPAGTFIEKLLTADDAAGAWRDDHGHHIHSIDKMTTSITEVFGAIKSSDAPYFYRYVIPALSNDKRGAEILTKIFDKENAAIHDQNIIAIGRRLVAKL